MNEKKIALSYLKEKKEELNVFFEKLEENHIRLVKKEILKTWMLAYEESSEENLKLIKAIDFYNEQQKIKMKFLIFKMKKVIKEQKKLRDQLFSDYILKKKI